MSRASQVRPPRHVHGSRTERAVLVFVLLALATLVAMPILLDRRVSELRREIGPAEAARGLVPLLEFTLVREMAALSEAMLTGDPTAREDYNQALQQEDSIFGVLAVLARQLGPGVMERFEEVRRSALDWHGRAADADDLLEEYGDVTEPRPRRERQLFGELLIQTRALDRAIRLRSETLRARIEAAEQLGLTLSFGLGFLALGAGGAAALLAGRSRRFAVESERRRVEAEIALEELAHQTELRERLLRGITHDVKNPLGAAKGYAELLAMGVKGPILPEQVPLVNGLQRSVEGALEIIADLLDVARADSGQLTVERVPTDLGNIVAEAVEDQRAQAEAAGHTLGMEPPGGALRIHTDPARVRQILQNLISNAVKYTPPPGTIMLATHLRTGEADSRNRSWAAIEVRDTGPGIPADMRERVFDEFTRLQEDGLIEGHGLGLPIARRIARLLGGDLRVEDRPGPGATFVLLLPLRGPSPDSDADDEAERTKGSSSAIAR